MIELIEAYIKQHHCRDYFNSYGETVEDDHYFMYREEVDGLIELIVRECVMVASNPHLNDEESYYGNEFAKAIKKHFGVEE
jgi:hypothetical protein